MVDEDNEIDEANEMVQFRVANKLNGDNQVGKVRDVGEADEPNRVDEIIEVAD